MRNPPPAKPAVMTSPREIRTHLLFLVFFSCLAATAHADTISVETGRGFHHSQHTEALFLRYEHEAPALFGYESFYEISAATWNGKNNASAIGVGRGARLSWGNKNYFSASIGPSFINRTTENLGTLCQFSLRFALGRQAGGYDLSLGYNHYSNGKGLFEWKGPNWGENFLTVQIGISF